MRQEGKQGAPRVLAFALTLALGASLAINMAQAAHSRALSAEQTALRQREMADVTAAMADIEINLAKLLLASGAEQSVELLGETALLAQHVESGLARLPIGAEQAGSMMKFAGQIGDYAMTLAAQSARGAMLTSDDEQQISQMLTACRTLNEQLTQAGAQMMDAPQDALTGDAQMQSWPEQGAQEGVEYPSLIYDGPFSDGRRTGLSLGLTGEALTREQARQAAARYAGTTADRVEDAADSGGTFEAYGFTAKGQEGSVSVQVTRRGGHLLWMVPEQAAFGQRLSQEECLARAKVYLADMGFGEMEPCFVQSYDGMTVANFASVQDGVLLYPDQVKVQVSMDSGTVVGAECSQYLTNHAERSSLEPTVTKERAQQMLSGRLEVESCRLCVIPQTEGERLCWGFRGTFGGAVYYVFIDAKTGEAADILRVAQTADGETAI